MPFYVVMTVSTLIRYLIVVTPTFLSSGIVYVLGTIIHHLVLDAFVASCVPFTPWPAATILSGLTSPFLSLLTQSSLFTADPIFSCVAVSVIVKF